VLLALRTWLRYFAPLIVVSAVALTPVALVGAQIAVPADAAAAKATIKVGYELAILAWFCQLVLVAGAAVAVRAVAASESPTQLQVLGRGLRGMARALVPCAVAACAIGLGGLALVIPGVMLMVLFVLTGASTELAAPLPAPLIDAAAVARRSLGLVIACVASMLLIEVGFAASFHVLVALLPAKPSRFDLADLRSALRYAVVTRVIASSLIAVHVAAAYAKATRRAGPAPAVPPPAPAPS
jgi:hypothetical protein